MKHTAHNRLISLALALFAAIAFSCQQATDTVFVPVVEHVEPDTAPPAPIDAESLHIQLTAGDGVAVLTWTNSADIDFYATRITAARTGADVLQTVVIEGEAGAVSSAQLAGLTAYGGSYTFTLYALDKSGNVSDGISKTVMPTSGTATDSDAPAAVTALAATSADESIMLSWADVSDSDIYGYEVHWETSAAIRAVALAANTLVVPHGQQDCTVTGLMNDTMYTFTVISVDTSGNKSAAVSVTAAPNATATTATAPVIVTQPSDATVLIPSVRVLTVGAYTADIGGMLTYQWYQVADEASEGTALQNEVEESLRIKVESAGKTGYYCIVTNTVTQKDGSQTTESVTSRTAWLTAVYLKDVVAAPVFTSQPVSLQVVPYGHSATLVCEAAAASNTISYLWYESADGSTDSGTFVAAGASFTTPAFTERGIRYYYCVAINQLTANESEDVKSASTVSDVFTVAYTGLPILYLDTGNVPTNGITKTEYVDTAFRLVAQGLGDGYENLETTVSLKGRGNSSWGLPKKGYNLKFSSKQSVFGLPKAKKWCIIANYPDKSLFRNKFSSVLGTGIVNTGWNPTFISVDLVLNGEYWGNYIFCEKITLTDGRIEVPDIVDVEDKLVSGKENKVEDLNGDGTKNLADGGFILEVDSRRDADFWFTSAQGIPFCLKDPDDVSSDVLEQIKSIVQTAEDVLYSDSFTDSENGWQKYIDAGSVIDWYIANEFAKNNDAIFFSSVYLHYNPADSKLYLGPNWDFDISCGNINYNGCDNAEGFWIKNSAWISRMFKDKSFVEMLKNRWNEICPQVYDAANIRIQALADDIAVSATLNFMKWQIPGTYVWPNAAGYADRTTYQSEVDYLTNWLNARYRWLDSAINGL